MSGRDSHVDLAAGTVTGVEGRSIANLRPHNNHIGDGLTYWAPNANMERGDVEKTSNDAALGCI